MDCFMLRTGRGFYRADLVIDEEDIDRQLFLSRVLRSRTVEILLELLVPSIQRTVSAHNLVHSAEWNILVFPIAVLFNGIADHEV